MSQRSYVFISEPADNFISILNKPQCFNHMSYQHKPLSLTIFMRLAPYNLRSETHLTDEWEDISYPIFHFSCQQIIRLSV